MCGYTDWSHEAEGIKTAKATKGQLNRWFGDKTSAVDRATEVR